VPLEAGNVITIEPGIYLAEEQIGIRVEDDVLVTSSGCENLSKEIVKEVAEIEAELSK
jgi:Xaa-Pro aminopeptidase